MSRLERFAALAVCILVAYFLNEYDSLAIEHDMYYGWIMRGTVWLIIGGIVIASYENIKTIFTKGE